MNEHRFRSILLELIDENPFAIRAILKLLDVEFTQSIATLAVTCEDKPRLLVNLAFVEEHCSGDSEVKAVICHEFLHVLLRHTEEHRQPTFVRNLAADAVINAIIHRQYGSDYSSFMARYYADTPDLKKLLRPMNEEERAWMTSKHGSGELPQWANAWDALYRGKLVVDDIEALALELNKKEFLRRSSGPFTLREDGDALPDDFLGNHENMGADLPDVLQEALKESMKEMNGDGIWRAPGKRGVGTNSYEALYTAKDEGLLRWRKTTLEILKRHLTPDKHSQGRRNEAEQYRLPVLSPNDRRSFLRSLWAPFLPDSSWDRSIAKRSGTAQVYLDVSGSMSAEMPLIVALLGQVSNYVRRPFWAFSDVVAPAIIEKGQLKAQTTGGTSMACVLEHVAKTRPESAVVVTDGYIETLNKKLVAKIAGTRLHVLVLRDGNPEKLRRAGLSYTQLPALKGVAA